MCCVSKDSTVGSCPGVCLSFKTSEFPTFLAELNINVSNIDLYKIF